MPHKPIDEILADNNNLLRNDAAAASIQPEEVAALLNTMAETSDIDAKRNADAAVMAQTDATTALTQADRAEKTAEDSTRIADLATTAANEAKASADAANTKADNAVTTAGAAKTQADTASTTAIAAQSTANNANTRANENRRLINESRGSINNLFDKDAEVERTLVGIQNSIDELEVPDTYDWAENGNTDPIPADKLTNAPGGEDTTARSTATNAFNLASQNNIRLNRLPVFGNAQIHPPGIRGQRFPRYMALDLSNKIEPRQITEIRVVAQGVTISITGSTQAALLQQLNSHGGIVNITMTNDNLDLIEENLNDSQQDIRFQLQYKFTGTNLGTGTPADAIDEIHFGVNNDSYLHQPEFIGSANFTTSANNRFNNGSSNITLPRVGFGLISFGANVNNGAMTAAHYIINFAEITALRAASNNDQASTSPSPNFASIAISSSTTPGAIRMNIGRSNGNRLLLTSSAQNVGAWPCSVYRY